MRFNEAKKEETQEVKFNAEEFVDKDAEPGFTSDVEDQEKLEKAFKKEMDKVVKFENFVTINIDNIENVEMEMENECEDEEASEEATEETPETSGCGCCDECTGEPGCYCGCPDCMCEIEDKEVGGTEDVIRFDSFDTEVPEEPENETEE